MGSFLKRGSGGKTFLHKKVFPPEHPRYRKILASSHPFGAGGPDELVHLELKSGLNLVRKHPFGQDPRGEFSEDRGKEDLTLIRAEPFP